MFELLRDRQRWERIREEDSYTHIRTLLSAGYDKYCKEKEISLPLFSEEMMFWQNGNRAVFEEKYFSRRAMLSVYSAYTMLYPENEEYLKRLEDVIYAICNEYDWGLPAHRYENWIEHRYTIDLFASETGLYLSEIKYMLKDRLNPQLVSLITSELDKRIMTSFENEHWLFEDLVENWSSVCGGSVGAVFMYEAPERFDKVRDRIEASMDNFLKSIPEDGACSEGVTYWNYGFEFYVLYYDLLRRFNGDDFGLKLEKVKKFAGFLNNMFMDKKTMVSFADADENSTFALWLPFFLNKEYGLDVPCIDRGVMTFSKSSVLLRELLYFDAEKVPEAIGENKAYYDALQVYAERKKKYSFAVKGGHNNELHNHNDVGSFIVSYQDKQVLCDLGRSEYTKDYFDDNKRYDIINLSSRGHSVPIVNGQAQPLGEEYSGNMTICDNVISIDLKNAYETDIEYFDRRFVLGEDDVVLTDRFNDGLSVVERFVTDIKPQMLEGVVKINDCELLVDKKAYSVKITEQEITRPKDICTLSLSNGEIVEYDCKELREIYLIDFTPVGNQTEFNMRITFKE